MKQITIVSIILLLCGGCKDDTTVEKDINEVEKKIELNMDKVNENKYHSRHLDSTNNDDQTIDSLIDLQSQ